MLNIKERVVQNVVTPHAWPTQMWVQMRAFSTLLYYHYNLEGKTT